ncbi:fimbria/pilus outer membrane usher protein [Sodalis praecaptivus]|uniref:fimbria/pilus outer membrane usher protein n=1 Tax=Sodalis praecaptivus TaxID=1239307 RepID=UPI00280C3B14|nr:fimbria/pilus outer membrane usher protein [Sodalis praecaptivus]
MGWLHAEEKYATDLLENVGGLSITDVSAFDKGNAILPGTYTLSVVVNDRQFDGQRITFKKTSNEKVEAVFSCDKLKLWGIAIDHCQEGEIPLTTYIPQAQTDVDLGDNTLTITVPQKYQQESSENDVASEKEWQDGINAAFSSYAVNSDTTRLKGVGRRNSLYGNFTNGVNMMGFRVRNNGFLNVTSGNKTRYVSSKNYIEHDIDTLHSTLTLGDFFTSDKIFAAQNLRGAAMATNNEMLANRERVYAPVITGVARSNATIIIKQNDFVIATRKVPPGRFALKDIPTSSSTGDMDITIVEANGDARHFSQSYNAVDVLVPAHSLRYSLYAGRNRSLNDAPPLAEADALYGLANSLTLIGGVQYANDYHNLAAGMGADVRWLGGLYGVINSSASDIETRGHQQGTMLTTCLSHSFAATGSYLYLTAEHRFAEGYEGYEGYEEYQDAMAPQADQHYRTRYTLQLAQPMEAVSLTVNLAQSVGFQGDNSHALGGSFSFTLSRMTVITSLSHQSGSQKDNLLSLNMSLPLGNEARHYLNYNQTRGQGGRSDDRLSLSGSLLEDDNLSYDIGASTSAGYRQNDSSLRWNAGKGTLSTSWSQDENSDDLTLGLEGSVIAHHHGITLGQPLTQSTALVHTDHVSDLPIANNTAVATDHFGNAIVTGLSPYRYNETALNTNKLTKQVEVDSNVYQNAPRQGAIIEVDFAAQKRDIHYAHIRTAEGAALPFGAVVYDAGDRSVGIVSAGGLTALNMQDSRWPLQIRSEEMTCRTSLQGVNKQSQIWELTCQ